MTNHHKHLSSKTSIPVFHLLLLFAISGNAVLAEIRTWTDSQGRSIKGELVNASDENVTLKINNTEHVLPYEKLSAADQEFAKSWLVTRRAEIAKRAFTFGDSTLVPGKTVFFKLPIDKSKTKDDAPEAYRCAVALPKDFDPSGEHPIFFVNGPDGHDATKKLKSYEEVIAANGVVCAINLNEAKSYNYILALFTEMWDRWPGSKEWPLVIGGNSGGAKKTAYVTAYLISKEVEVCGMFMGGCNEDRTGDAASWIKLGGSSKTKYKKVPVFLSSGLEDKTANTRHVEAVENSMKKFGMKTVRRETFAGGHSVHKPHPQQAVEWFLELRNP